MKIIRFVFAWGMNSFIYLALLRPALEYKVSLGRRPYIARGSSNGWHVLELNGGMCYLAPIDRIN